MSNDATETNNATVTTEANNATVTTEPTEATVTTEPTEATVTTEPTKTTVTTEPTEATKKTETSGPRDIIYIGKKPLMAYVTSTLIQLSNISCVTIKARGMSIGRAVDVSQIISRKTENAGYTIGNIKLGSEALESQDGRTRNVSTIDIEVKRKV
jgi:DNA-binding protein